MTQKGAKDFVRNLIEGKGKRELCRGINITGVFRSRALILRIFDL